MNLSLGTNLATVEITVALSAAHRSGNTRFGRKLIVLPNRGYANPYGKEKCSLTRQISKAMIAEGDSYLCWQDPSESFQHVRVAPGIQ